MGIRRCRRPGCRRPFEHYLVQEQSGRRTRVYACPVHGPEHEPENEPEDEPEPTPPAAPDVQLVPTPQEPRDETETATGTEGMAPWMQ